MNKFTKRLKKLGKKALIRLIKSLRNEIARLHRAINTLREDHKELERQVNIACDEVMILRKQLAEPVPPRIQIRDEDDRVLNDDTDYSPRELVRHHSGPLSAIEPGDKFHLVQGDNPPNFVLSHQHGFHCLLNDEDDFNGILTTDTTDPVTGNYLKFQWKGLHQKGCWAMHQIKAKLISNKEDS